MSIKNDYDYTKYGGFSSWNNVIVSESSQEDPIKEEFSYPSDKIFDSVLNFAGRFKGISGKAKRSEGIFSSVSLDRSYSKSSSICRSTFFGSRTKKRAGSRSLNVSKGDINSSLLHKQSSNKDEETTTLQNLILPASYSSPNIEDYNRKRELEQLNRKINRNNLQNKGRKALVLPKVGNKISTFNQSFGQGFTSSVYDASSKNRYKKYQLPEENFAAKSSMLGFINPSQGHIQPSPGQEVTLKLPNLNPKYKVQKCQVQNKCDNKNCKDKKCSNCKNMNMKMQKYKKIVSLQTKIKQCESERENDQAAFNGLSMGGIFDPLQHKKVADNNLKKVKGKIQVMNKEKYQIKWMSSVQKDK